MDDEKLGKEIYTGGAISPDGNYGFGETETPKTPLSRRFIDSFKRDPNIRTASKPSANGHAFDVEGAAAATAESPLARKLKGRHLQMIAIGGSIGMAFCSYVKSFERPC